MAGFAIARANRLLDLIDHSLNRNENLDYLRICCKCLVASD